MEDRNSVEVEWLILADAAQVVGNKLYLMGGGWDVLTVNSAFPVQQHCALAASFRVPWSETNRPHSVEIEIQDDDGGRLMQATAQVEIGRPPGMAPQPQRVQIAADMLLEFKRPGTYVVIARVEGQSSERVPFRVVPGPMVQGQPAAG